MMDGVDELVGGVVGWAKANPMLLMLLCWVAFQMWARTRPFPTVEGSRVQTISSTEDFEALAADCKRRGGVLVVDYYATWCPPCRKAAPVYGEMSKVYGEVAFAKVNVDEARDVAQAHGIRAMPTFKVFGSDGAEVSSIQGWDESTLRTTIIKAVNAK